MSHIKLCIATNAEQRCVPCGICGKLFMADEGPAMFRVSPWAPVCNECAAKGDRNLFSALIFGLMETDPDLLGAAKEVEIQKENERREAERN